MRYICPFCEKPMPSDEEPEQWVCCGEGGHAVEDLEDCTCKPRYAGPQDLSPPEGRILDKWCSVHGKDPDAEYDRLRYEQLNEYPQERDDAEV